MVAQVGRTMRLLWGDTTPVLVAGVREKGIEAAGEPVDVTNDDSDGVRTLIDAAQVSSVNIPVSGVLENDTLRADWIAGNGVDTASRLQDARFEWPILNPANSQPATLEGKFYLSEYSETGAHDGEITFEATFMSAGPLTYTAEAV